VKAECMVEVRSEVKERMSECGKGKRDIRKRCEKEGVRREEGRKWNKGERV